MTTTLALRLPWGRYHATPWDKSANEAAVEWPPSPWRILRALYSSWKTHCPHLDDSAVEALLEALAQPPRYLLPPFTVAHSRHYLPGTSHMEGRRTETAKTFDAFVVTARDAELLIEWPNDLSDEALSILRQLAEGLSYIGRADAIVEGRVEHGGPGTEGRWLSPVEPASGGQTTRLLSPDRPLDLTSLTQSPHQVRSDRLLQPKSTRWVAYPTPVPAVPSTVRRLTKRAKPTAVRFAVTGRPLPAKHAAVALGDMTRWTAMSSYGHQNDQGVSVMLAGKDAGSVPLGGRHQHAHYLSTSSNGRSLDSVVVWAPAGFDDRELMALARTMKFVGSDDYDHTGGIAGRRLGVEAFGEVGEIAPELAGVSAVWLSHTPYAPARHWKGSLEEQVFADVSNELKYRGLPSPLGVELVRGDWLAYRRYRLRKERINDARRAYGVRLIFDEPVAGPICLGQLSHYGLGLFLPEQS